MSTNTPRTYNCKDEELPVICRYSVLNLKRDLNGFTTYSPKLNGEFVTVYEAKIAEAEELVAPEAETVEMKKITNRWMNILKM